MLRKFDSSFLAGPGCVLPVQKTPDSEMNYFAFTTEPCSTRYPPHQLCKKYVFQSVMTKEAGVS